MLNSITSAPSWLAAHWRGASLIACGIGAITVLRWNYDKDPERKARTQEKDLHSLAEKISKYALAMQEKYPTGSVVVSEEDLAGALHRAPEKQEPWACFKTSKKSSVPRSPATGS